MLLRRFTYICAVAMTLLMGCSKEGPMGPDGPPGPAGATRTVLSGIVSPAANTPTGQLISVPQLILASFPLVGVYISDGTGDWIQCNSILYNPTAMNYPIYEVAILRNGSVTLFSTQVGNEYRIVTVT